MGVICKSVSYLFIGCVFDSLNSWNLTPLGIGGIGLPAIIMNISLIKIELFKCSTLLKMRGAAYHMYQCKLSGSRDVCQSKQFGGADHIAKFNDDWIKLLWILYLRHRIQLISKAQKS